ncbi:class II fructose-bisphosphatase [Candidatus Micrarchaeota archaeon]|nr:class II fructose-bisphosphatase [Candidatus Micrarchaeota archaeon]
MDRNLALEFVRVTEAAAVSAARWMGRGDNHAADKAAVERMREGFNSMSFSGRVVIGEGERDEAPMLYIGEEVGKKNGVEIDLAVDPLEGTTITAKGGPNALCVLAAGPKGSLLNAPDCYMDKIAVGRKARGKVSLDAMSVEENILAVAHALGKEVGELVVIILERERHNDLIKKVRGTGARIKLISDGDVSGALSTCVEESGIDMLLGTGGAPEGVISAAAVKCLDGDFQGKLVFRNDKERERAKAMKASEGVLKMNDLVKSHAMFVATGVTDGSLLEGVRFRHETIETHSLVMRSKTRTVRFVKALHNDKYVHST